MLLIVLTLGFWYPIVGLSMLICMVSPLIVAIRRGRHWCGWICPRGSFFDKVMTKVSPNRSMPKWLSSQVTRYVILAALFGMMGYQLHAVWGDATKVGFVLWRLLGITTLVGIVLSLAYKPRSWCSICPVGTLSSAISRSQRKVVVGQGCKSCGVCAKACPMALKPHVDSTSQADCLGCQKCIAKCPFGQLSMYGQYKEVSIRQKTGDDISCGYRQ